MFVYCFSFSIVFISVLVQVETHNFFIFTTALSKKEVNCAPNCVRFSTEVLKV